MVNFLTLLGVWFQISIVETNFKVFQSDHTVKSLGEIQGQGFHEVCSQETSILPTQQFEETPGRILNHCITPYWKQWSTSNSQKSLKVQKRPESLKKPKSQKAKKDKSENKGQSKTKPKKNGKQKISKKKEKERNLPVIKMTPRNSALIVRKIMGPTGHTTQWTVGSSEQQKGEVRMPRN